MSYFSYNVFVFEQQNGQTKEQTDGQTNKRTNKRTDKQTDRQPDRHEQTKRWTDARIKTERNLRELTITKEVNKQEIKEERRLFTISKLQAFKARFMYKYVLYC